MGSKTESRDVSKSMSSHPERELTGLRSGLCVWVQGRQAEGNTPCAWKSKWHLLSWALGYGCGLTGSTCMAPPAQRDGRLVRPSPCSRGQSCFCAHPNHFREKMVNHSPFLPAPPFSSESPQRFCVQNEHACSCLYFSGIQMCSRVEDS